VTSILPELYVKRGRAAVEFYIERAVAAGATEISPVGEEHGWLGRIADPSGHHWEIGIPLRSWPPRGACHGSP
jgi:uncharacterized glyoxalase superfamily protein PhnB